MGQPTFLLSTLLLLLVASITTTTTGSAQSPSSLSVYPTPTSYLYEPWSISNRLAIDPVRSLLYFIDSSAWLRQFSTITQRETSPRALLPPNRFLNPRSSDYYQPQGSWRALTVAFNGDGEVFVTTQCWNVSTCIDAIYVYNTSLSLIRTAIPYCLSHYE